MKTKDQKCKIDNEADCLEPGWSVNCVGFKKEFVEVKKYSIDYYWVAVVLSQHCFPIYAKNEMHEYYPNLIKDKE